MTAGSVETSPQPLATATLDGYYINLDRAVERNTLMQEQIRQYGLDWIERFPAVDAALLTVPQNCPLRPGELACFLSHVALLKQTPPDSYTLVLEDDTQFSPDLANTLKVDQLDRLRDVDILFLDCQPSMDITHIGAMYQCLGRAVKTDVGCDDLWNQRIKGVELINAKGYYQWAANAYVVTPKGKRRLPSILQECLDRGPPGPIDILYRDCIDDGRLNCLITVPFLASARLHYQTDTTIQDRDRSEDRLLLASVIRRMFFAGDMSDALTFAEQVLATDRIQNEKQKLLSELIAQVFLVATRDGGYPV